MSPSQLTIKLLAGGGLFAGVVAGVILAGAGAAAAAPKGATPPPKTPVILTAPVSPGAGTTPTWTFSDPNKTGSTQCSLTAGATVVFPPAACSVVASFNLAGKPYTTYTFTVTALVNNFSASATGTYTLIPGPPAITSAPSSPGNDTTPTWAFTLPAGTTGRCSLTRSGATVAGPLSCSGSQTFSVSGDAAYTFSVAAVAPNGSVSAASTSTYTLDTTPPPPPAITGAPSDPSTDDTPAWSFTTSGGAVATTCTLTQGSTVVSAPSSCTSPAAFDLTAQPDAVYTFSVTATDAAGNVSAPATSTYTLQRLAAPAAPTITSSPSSPASSTTPAWSFTTPTGTADQCTLLANSTVVAGPAACALSQGYTLSTDGTYTFQVIAYDTATGARSAAVTSTYTLDRTPPAVPVFTATPASPGTATTPSWSFTTPAGAASLTCTLRRGTTVIAGPTTCAGTFSKNLTSQGDGTYTLSVVAVDGAGNASSPATSAYVLDRTGPGAPVLTGPTLTNSTTPTWTLSVPAGATATCEVLSTTTVVLGPTPCGPAFTPNLSGLSDGTYSVMAVAVDAAGNVGPSATWGFTLDRTPPPVPTISKGPAGTSSNLTPSWSYKAPGSTTTQCSLLRGTTVVIGPLACSSPAAFDLSKLPDGTYTFSVVALDAAGNASLPARSSYTLHTSRASATPVTVAPAPPAPAAPAPTAGPAPAPAAANPLPDGAVRRAPATPPPTAAPAPTPAPPAPVPAPLPSPSPVPEIIHEAGKVVTAASKTAAFPLILLALVVLFLAVQDQIDRRDPKLAQAPVQAGEDLAFGPPPTRTRPTQERQR
jgi:hypothetical protein